MKFSRILQIHRGIENLAAAPASHPPVGDAKLVPDHLERGGARGAAGDQTHEAQIVGLPPREARRGKGRLEPRSHQDPAVFAVRHFERCVGCIGLLQFVGLAIENAGENQ